MEKKKRTDLFKVMGLEIPINPETKEPHISSIQLKQFIVLLTEYMGADDEKQNRILRTYPYFEELYDVFENKIIKILRNRLEVRGQLDAFE